MTQSIYDGFLYGVWISSAFFGMIFFGFAIVGVWAIIKFLAGFWKRK